MRESTSFEMSTPCFDEKKLEQFLDFHEGSYLRVGIRGSREYLDAFLNYFRSKSFTVVETSIKDLGGEFPIPEEMEDKGYVIVVDSTGDWDNHSMNKNIKSQDLGVADQQNAVFISWSSNKNETSGGGSEFDTSFIEK